MQRVGDVMSGKLVTVSPLTTVGEGGRLMRSHGVHHLLVVAEQDGERRLVCVCDLEDRDPQTPIAEIESMPVTTISVAARIREAADRFKSLGIGCLVVVSGGRPVGTLTRTELRRIGVPLAELATIFCAACRGRDAVVVREDEEVEHLDCLERYRRGSYSIVPETGSLWMP
jgi:predicted transcriptional regulator